MAQEETRRQQLVETTIDTIAELGFVGTTLAQIATRADVSPGLVSHYFGDKEGLLDTTLRVLAARVSRSIAERLKSAEGAAARVRAIVDASLAAEEFEQRTGTVWLAFWGQAVHSARLNRVQRAYQQRLLSNLRAALGLAVDRDHAARLALMIAALIDGVWLRAALSSWQEADSETARAMISGFIDSELARNPKRSPRPSPRAALRNHIGGRFIESDSGRFTSIDPSNGAVLAEIETAGPAEIEQAVEAAKRGQAVWARMTGAERGRVLRRTAELLRAHNDELARLETQDTGKPIAETSVVDVASGADCLEYYGSLAGSLAGEHVDLGPAAFGYTRREPLGICAGIGAWNYPLQIACWKAAPALACGNAMIFKPAELTPLTAARLAELFVEAGLPDGVFNVVQGAADTGRLLTGHKAIAKISLTGEVGTGRRVMEAAAATLKAVTLELGGKSPLIVFDDARLDNAVSAALLANFYSAGEVCSNGTRVFVHRRVQAAFLDKLAARVARMRVGLPLDPATQVGALISQGHMEKVLSYIEAGRAGGATLVAGGHRVIDGKLAEGAFVAPTIFAGCRDDMRIVREEIFGPVMSVLAFDDEEEVIERANATDFGLAAGVFTQDLTRGHRVIAALEAGTCWINHYNVTPIELPFGGVKQSGIGRENGRAAIEHYSRLKSVYVAMQDVDSPY